MTTTTLHHRAGTLARNGFALDLDPTMAGWGYTSLRIVELAPDSRTRFSTGQDEVIILPLAGSCTVSCNDDTFDLAGRAGVFAGVTDFVYAPRNATVEIASMAGGRFAVPGARAGKDLPARYQPPGQVQVELRGAGQCSRQMVNFCTPGVFEADRLIAVEAYTPAGNWSSFPPHKHDEERDGETALEEIYYYEIADGPGGPGMAYQRVYGTDDRPIDVLAEVRTGDVVLIPYGWHGPSIAAPGYDLYFLNVMAGPGPERAWCICNDPAHAWIRDTWDDQQMDPRLPLPGFRNRPMTTDASWGHHR